MKLSKIFAGLFALMGFVLAIAVAGIAISLRETSPVLLGEAQGPVDTAVEMMDAVCDGDYETASSLILGNPKFGIEMMPEDPVEEMVWQAFAESFTYEILTQPYATDSGVAMEVRLTCLELNSVTKNLRARSQELMQQRIDSSEDVSEVYDENNEYLESFVFAALHDAAQQALEEDVTYQTMEFTVSLVWQNGRWWVVQDSGMLRALTGGIVK